MLIFRFHRKMLHQILYMHQSHIKCQYFFFSGAKKGRVQTALQRPPDSAWWIGTNINIFDILVHRTSMSWNKQEVSHFGLNCPFLRNFFYFLFFYFTFYTYYTLKNSSYTYWINGFKFCQCHLKGWDIKSFLNVELLLLSRGRDKASNFAFSPQNVKHCKYLLEGSRLIYSPCPTTIFGHVLASPCLTLLAALMNTLFQLSAA